MSFLCLQTVPRCSMYGIFTYIWVIFRANVGKYSSTMEHLGYDFQDWNVFSWRFHQFFSSWMFGLMAQDAEQTSGCLGDH